MAKWGTNIPKGSASVQSIALITAAASSPSRAKVYDIALGCADSPADNTFSFIVQRCTTAGTGTTVTPNALDPADSLATSVVATGTVTADPTLTSNAFLYAWPVNQRTAVRWVASPGSEFVIPATASNGIMVGLASASTATFKAGVLFEQQ